MNDRIAHQAMDETAELAQKNVIAMRSAMHKRNDLQRYVIEGPYKRERKNPRLGLLICCIGALTVIGLIGWAMS